jgi:hypothetical protein
LLYTSADNADMEELYPEYECHPCNPWSRSPGFGIYRHSSVSYGLPNP